MPLATPAAHVPDPLVEVDVEVVGEPILELDPLDLGPLVAEHPEADGHIGRVAGEVGDTLGEGGQIVGYVRHLWASCRCPPVLESSGGPFRVSAFVYKSIPLLNSSKHWKLESRARGVRSGPDSLGSLMDAQVPAVVAVMVTTEPGPWFEEALSALAAQDYQELSILVLSNGRRTRSTERVGRVLPDAFVRALPGRVGYGPPSNEALEMVEGAAFFLLCHDDVAPDHDAVGRLVEEAFRSNAGVVSPKFVNWDDPRILLHVV